MLFKKFWLYTALFLFCLLSVIAYAIWSSSKPVIVSTPAASEPVQQETRSPSSEVEQASADEAPAHFPAPAKKLHQVIHSQEGTQASLEQKTQALDKQLDEINQQLAEQGVAVPTASASTEFKTPASQSDTEKRLQAIKEHMQNKNN